MPWPAILIIVGVLSLVGVIAFAHHVHEKKRTAQLQELAASIGLEFSPGPDRTLSSRFESFSLFNQGRNRIAWNVMSGSTNEERLLLFDYRYTTGGGKHQQTHKRTVVCIESSLLRLPQFEMRPETWLDRFSEMFGQKEIDLESFPEFSKRYHLTGSGDRLLVLFNEPLVRKFESLHDVCSAGYGQKLIFYRASKRATVENFRSLMQDAYAIYALMKQPSEEAPTS